MTLPITAVSPSLQSIKRQDIRTSALNPTISCELALTDTSTTPRPGDHARNPFTNGSSAGATTVASTTNHPQPFANGNTPSNGSLLRVGEARRQPEDFEHPPPSKRQHIQQNPTQWHDQKVFVECLADQVFPHVDKELAKLPKDQYDVKKLGTKVSMLRRSP